MPAMIDGAGLFREANPLSALPPLGDLGQIFPTHNLFGARLKAAHYICDRHQSEVETLLALLTTYRFQPAGWHVDLWFQASDVFSANAGRTDDKSYLIAISIACPVVLLSIATELHLRYARKGDVALNDLYAGTNSVKSWLLGVEKIGDIPGEIVRTALDASLLLAMHEFAHVMFGHCNVEFDDLEKDRALEMDADFNAGTMFALHVANVDAATSPKQIVPRLCRGAFILGIALKALSQRSDRYHFPTNRTRTFIAGAINALERSGVVPSFEDEFKGNQYWANAISQNIGGLERLLRVSSLAYFAGTEIDLAQDDAAMWGITAKVRDDLKDGLLAKHQIPVSS